MDYHVPSAAEMRRNPNAVVDQLIPPAIRAAFPGALAIKIRNCADGKPASVQAAYDFGTPEWDAIHGADPGPTIDQTMIEILCFLYERAPMPQQEKRIAVLVVRNRKTVGAAIDRLCTAGLVWKPHGWKSRKGWTLTARGKTEAETLSRGRK